MKQAWTLFALGVMLLAGRAFAQPAVVVLDPLIDWKNPLGLTMEKLQRFCSTQTALKNNNWLKVTKRDEDHISASLTQEANFFALQLGAHGVHVRRFIANFQDLKLHSAQVFFDSSAHTDADFVSKFIEDIMSLEGGPAPVFTSGEIVGIRWSPQAKQNVEFIAEQERQLWQRQGWYMMLVRTRPLSEQWFEWGFIIGKGDAPARKAPEAAPADAPPEIAAEMAQPRPALDLKADLDPLLDFNTIWKTTADQFEKRYIARTPEQQQKDPPQFEWLTTAKDRARFSRQMFADAPTTLTLFGGTVKVEEAVVEFVKGKAGRATISIYNRGDAGQMGRPEFQAIFKKVGQSLGDVLKVAPRRQMSAGTGAVKNVVWMWTSPLGVALLEHNDFESQGGNGRPEYLRLKVAAPDQADWTMGRMSLGVQRMTLQKNVTRDAAVGDIFIAGVPMVDQGAKGYCVAASCQRLLEYMRIPCDQHEMAQLLSVDVERGANAFEMQKSLAKVDQKFGVTFKPLVNPEQYYGGAGKRRVSLNQFTSIIKEHADKGIPLLWALGLGQFPEDPPLPNGGQVNGGHMRMIIGYNAAKNQVIFTDSWGAGHEKKRMDAANAYEATLGLYSMSPRGL